MNCAFWRREEGRKAAERGKSKSAGICGTKKKKKGCVRATSIESNRGGAGQTRNRGSRTRFKQPFLWKKRKPGSGQMRQRPEGKKETVRGQASQMSSALRQRKKERSPECEKEEKERDRIHTNEKKIERSKTKSLKGPRKKGDRGGGRKKDGSKKGKIAGES